MIEQKQITQELMGSWITPKKFVHNGFSFLASTCRLFNSICNNVYTKNCVLLTIAEELNAGQNGVQMLGALPKEQSEFDPVWQTCLHMSRDPLYDDGVYKNITLILKLLKAIE